MNDDFRDFLAALLHEEARFLVVGAHALAFHGVPRATGDLDVWIDRSLENAERVWQALVRFGVPIEERQIQPEDLVAPNQVIQFGLPPRRIDLLTSVSGIEFKDAWPARVLGTFDERDVPFLSRSDLVRNKRASGRLRDLADLESLGETP